MKNLDDIIVVSMVVMIATVILAATADESEFKQQTKEDNPSSSLLATMDIGKSRPKRQFGALGAAILGATTSAVVLGAFGTAGLTGVVLRHEQRVISNNANKITTASANDLNSANTAYKQYPIEPAVKEATSTERPSAAITDETITLQSADDEPHHDERPYSAEPATYHHHFHPHHNDERRPYYQQQVEPDAYHQHHQSYESAAYYDQYYDGAVNSPGYYAAEQTHHHYSLHQDPYQQQSYDPDPHSAHEHRPHPTKQSGLETFKDDRKPKDAHKINPVSNGGQISKLVEPVYNKQHHHYFESTAVAGAPSGHHHHLTSLDSLSPMHSLKTAAQLIVNAFQKTLTKTALL